MNHRTRFSTRNRTLGAALAFALALASVPTATAAAAAAEAKVNVNKATVAQLALLPRIGPAVAQRIAEFREANGPFKTVEDLLLVRGIGDRTLEQLKPYVALSGETTLTEKVRVARTPAAVQTAPETGGR